MAVLGLNMATNGQLWSSSAGGPRRTSLVEDLPLEDQYLKYSIYGLVRPVYGYLWSTLVNFGRRTPGGPPWWKNQKKKIKIKMK